MQALVECQKGTKDKYETVLTVFGYVFFIDRVLNKRWAESYGCIPKTLQADGDELDSYIIGKRLKQGDLIDVLPICIIYSDDNGETDNKLICAAKTGNHIKHRVRRIVRFIKSYKKGSKVLSISWSPENIRYELAKCKAYFNLFKGGKACQY